MSRHGDNIPEVTDEKLITWWNYFYPVRGSGDLGLMRIIVALIRELAKHRDLKLPD